LGWLCLGSQAEQSQCDFQRFPVRLGRILDKKVLGVKVSQKPWVNKRRMEVERYGDGVS
jgi:hypothetical protein